jgi:GH25 family lysozyme M1 (1,4-beta-N-acetylmuramidase)
MRLRAKGAIGVIYGVDVSAYQGKPDWRKVYDAGIRFGLSKVSENNNYVNSAWAHNKTGMAALGAVFAPGGYHYLRSGTDPAEQARYFHAAAGDMTNWMVVLDVERITNSAGVVVSKPTAAQAHAWVTEYKKRAANHKVLGYLPRWYWEELGRPDLSFFDGLWGSHYVSGTGSPATLYSRVSASWWDSYGGEKVVALQHSSSGTVPGVSGKCDVNAYKGTTAELKAAAIGGAPAPKPWPGRLLKYTSGKPYMRGSDVDFVQVHLTAKGFKVDNDGIYGGETAKAVRGFQRAKHLAVDGVVGAKTWNALAKP